MNILHISIKNDFFLLFLFCDKSVIMPIATDLYKEKTSKWFYILKQS